ncbi:MAG: GYD domain-containing protein [Actinomycetota bacterium]
MARFMFKVSYSKEGMQGVIKEGAVNRKTFIEKMAAEMGGSISSFDFAFGDTDAYVIAEMEDQITAAAVATAVTASGAGSIETVVLLSADDVDRAIGKHAPYRAPGA